MVRLGPGGGLAGSALVSINLVTVRRARLILGWVTASGQVNHLRYNQPPRSTQPFILPGSVISYHKGAGLYKTAP